jgi:flagellar hook-associated protein 3 FlgL
MSGTVQATDYGFSAQLIANSAALKAQVDKLTEQSSTGYVAPDLGGLGARVGTAVDLGAQVARIKATQTDITSATTQIQAAQSVMTQLSKIAQQFETSATQLATTSSVDIGALAGQARDALAEVAGLLNTQSNGQYLFSGQDTGNPAVPNDANILTSTFYTSIQTAVGTLATNGAAATEASATTAATGNTPFSATRGTAVPTVAGVNGQQIGIGIVAGINAAAVSPASNSTGSYMLDLMRNLAVLGSLTASQGNATGLSTLATDTASSFQAVVVGLGTDAGLLGSRESLLTDQSTQLGDLSTALSVQLSSAQDVDMASVATRLSQAQTQLQASYQLIAAMKSLSLVNYL